MTSYIVSTNAFKSLIGLLSAAQIRTVTFDYNPEERNVLSVRALDDARVMLVQFVIYAQTSNDTEDTFTIETDKAKAIIPLITDDSFELNISAGMAIFRLGNITRRIGLAFKTDSAKTPSFDMTGWIKFTLPHEHIKKVLAAATFTDFFTIETNEFDVIVSAKGDNDDISAKYDKSDYPAMRSTRVNVLTEYVKAILANIPDDLDFSIETDRPVCIERMSAKFSFKALIAPRIDSE